MQEAAAFTAAEVLVDFAAELEVFTGAEALLGFAVEASTVFVVEALAGFADVPSLVDLASRVTAMDSVSTLGSGRIGDTRISMDMARGGPLTLTTIRTIPTTTRTVLITPRIIATLAITATAAIIAMRMLIPVNQITKMLRQSLRAQMFPKALLSVIM